MKKKQQPAQSKQMSMWIPITLLSSILVGLGVGFSILMHTCYKPEPEIITKEVKVGSPMTQQDFMDFIENLPTCATKSNLQVVIGADLEGDSAGLYQILSAYAKMKLDEAKPKAD
jgi:hypothetical protein